MLTCGLASSIAAASLLLIVTLISVTPSQAVTDYNANGLDCWEMCFLDAFQDPNVDNAEKQRLQSFLKLVNRVKQIRIKHKINSTVLTVDTTVRRNHAFDYDHAGIFKFQQHLAALIVLTMPAWSGNPAFHSQFDGEQAWYCNNWSCNSRCTASENILYDFEDVLESSTPGLIEDGCHLGRKALKHDDCSMYQYKNPLLIAIVNSQFNDHHNKKQRNSHSSSCRKYRERLVVGTHASEWRQLKDFASSANNAIYIEDSPENKKTLSGLIDCMQLECCMTAPPPSSTDPAPICLRTVSGFDVDEFRVKK